MDNFFHIEAVREFMNYTEEEIEEILDENGWVIGDEWQQHYSGEPDPYCTDIWARACAWAHKKHIQADVDLRRIAAFATTVGWVTVPMEFRMTVISYPHGLDNLEMFAPSAISHAARVCPRPMEDAAHRDFTKRAIVLLDAFVWEGPEDDLSWELKVACITNLCGDEEKWKTISDELARPGGIDSRK